MAQLAERASERLHAERAQRLGGVIDADRDEATEALPVKMVGKHSLDV